MIRNLLFLSMLTPMLVLGNSNPMNKTYADQYEVKLLEVNNPSSSLSCNTSFNPSITVINNGTETITELQVYYFLDGGGAVSQTFSNLSIPNNSKDLLVLNQITTNVGSHSIQFIVDFTNGITDAFADNNILTVDFKTNSELISIDHIYGFESKADELFTENEDESNSMWGIYDPSSPAFKKTNLTQTSSGSSAYFTDKKENYPTSMISYLYTPCYDLTTITDPTIYFQMGFEIEEDWDYMQMEYSTNGGNNWNLLGTAADENWYNSSSTQYLAPGNQWTGEGHIDLQEYSYRLTDLSNETNIVFRFKFVSDLAISYQGAVIDDFTVSEYKEASLSTNTEDITKEVLIYPNPSKGRFTIKWSHTDKTNISIYNIMGQQVYTKRNIENLSANFDLQDFSSGVYMIKISSQNKQGTRRLIIE